MYYILYPMYYTPKGIHYNIVHYYILLYTFMYYTTIIIVIVYNSNNL